MKVSLNWIKEYLGFELPSTDELVEKIGSQLGEVEEVTDLGQKYRGVVVVKVMSCEQHPNADRLHVCTIDDGGITPDVKRDEQGYVQVVCGAPNVREGITVAWLPPGSTVPSSFDGEPFVLEARELRGVVSNGMLASPKELSIGDSHEGILEIDTDATPGSSFAEIYGLDDVIIDIENKMFTHRPDCFGQLGVAREVAGILGQPFTSPEWYKRVNQGLVADGERLSLTVRNELPELVPRFMAVAISNIDVQPSPIWMQAHLARVGIRPISNVVDITNYLMMLTGQPLHAYDYDKVAAISDSGTATLVVRNPHADEKLELLNGKVVTPRSEAIVIATDMQAIGLGGVMGGSSTEVDANTKNIILECASFDMYSIRRTSMAHGLLSEAVTRFNKGQSPLQNDRILLEAARLVCEFAGATELASEVFDDNRIGEAAIERESLYPSIKVEAAFINARLGCKLSASDMAVFLSNVECGVEINGEELIVTAPFWRTDIETREDIVEEVGRLYGFDKLPLELTTRGSTPAIIDTLLATKDKVRDVLSNVGANEVLTYSFVHGQLLDKVGQNRSDAFKLSNALSPDLQYFRLSLTPSLLDKVHLNIKAGYDEFALYEIGKTHIKQPSDAADLPAEFERLALVFASNDKAAKAHSGAAFYAAKKYLQQVLKAFGIDDAVVIEPLDQTSYAGITQTKIPQYEIGRAATIVLGDYCLGEIGEYKAAVRKSLKLPAYTAGFELDLALLTQYLHNRTAYHPLPKYPGVDQDICLKVPQTVTYSELQSYVVEKLRDSDLQNTLSDIKPVDIYQRDDDPDYKQITLRLHIANYDRTMTDTEVSKLLDSVAEAAHATYGAERI